MQHLPKQSVSVRYTVRGPWFAEKDIGLGNVIKRATSAVGFKPCTGCERRAAALDRWLVFTGKHHK